ncbi:MAG: hypothetical protein C4294_18885 [Nitrospiraceae bacterium]
MRKATRKAVHQLLKNFAQKSLLTYDVEFLKKAYPFHRLFFDDVGLVAFKQERSVVTKMGQTLYPELARLVAADKHHEVQREKKIEGELSVTMDSTIRRIVGELRAKQRIPNHALEIAEVVNAKASGKRVSVRVIADLYIGDFPTGPFFAEIKTPLPNLDICAESKLKILTFEALRHTENARGYLVFAYNPFVTRAAYAHGFTKQLMDMDKEVLMGEEFWNVIGGRRTFTELLDIIDAVGEEIRAEREGKSADQAD